jgi:biotin carboxyl carrier protein
MRKMEVTLNGRVFEIEIDPGAQCSPALRVHVNGKVVEVLVPNINGQEDGLHWLAIDGRPYELKVDRNLSWIQDACSLHEVQIREKGNQSSVSSGKSGPVKAPIPGQIARLFVAPGESVEAGQPLLVLEAMKMQNEIFAQAPGIVQAVHVAAGKNVKRGELLVEITDPE